MWCVTNWSCIQCPSKFASSVCRNCWKRLLKSDLCHELRSENIFCWNKTNCYNLTHPRKNCFQSGSEPAPSDSCLLLGQKVDDCVKAGKSFGLFRFGTCQCGHCMELFEPKSSGIRCMNVLCVENETFRHDENKNKNKTWHAQMCQQNCRVSLNP